MDVASETGVAGPLSVSISVCLSGKLPEGRLGMSDVSPLSGISGLSSDSPFLSPLLFFLPSPFALTVLSFFLLMVHSPVYFTRKFSDVFL